MKNMPCYFISIAVVQALVHGCTALVAGTR